MIGFEPGRATPLESASRMTGSGILDLVQQVVNRFSQLSNVIAVAHGGSQATSHADAQSDFDLYIFSNEEISPAARSEIASHYSSTPEIDNRFFGPEDGWRDDGSGAKFDLVYWSPAWLEDQIDRVLVRFAASVGYSTSFWYTVRHAKSLYDPTGWFGRLKARTDRPYPEELRRNIIAMNQPLLRESGSSFLTQIELAQARGDMVSVQHRVTAFLASYFDILFALNRLPHPGEKRLISIAQRDCHLLPVNMAQNVERLIVDAAAASTSDAVVSSADILTDGIDDLIAAEVE